MLVTCQCDGRVRVVTLEKAVNRVKRQLTTQKEKEKDDDDDDFWSKWVRLTSNLQHLHQPH